MKLDIDYIVSILQAVEDYPKASMPQKNLLSTIGCNEKNDEHVEKFYYHMMRIAEMGLLNCPHHGDDNPTSGFGFSFFRDKTMRLTNTDYQLTMRGIEYMEKNSPVAMAG